MPVRNLYSVIPPVGAAVKRGSSELTPERAFHIQLLLIHFYRLSSLKTLCCRRSCFRLTGQGYGASAVYQHLSARSACCFSVVSEKGETSVGELPSPGSLYFNVLAV